MSAPIPFGQPYGFGRGGPGGGVIQTPLMDAVPPASRSLDLPLPEIFPIPDAREFNPLGTIATAAVQAGVTITGTSIDIPALNLAIIRSISVSISNMTALTNVTFSLVVNDTPAQGYAGISIFPRVTPFVSNTFDCFIRVKGPVTVKIIFSNVDGGPYTVGGAFSGWFWPEQSDARWRASGQ